MRHLMTYSAIAALFAVAAPCRELRALPAWHGAPIRARRHRAREARGRRALRRNLRHVSRRTRRRHRRAGLGR